MVKNITNGTIKDCVIRKKQTKNSTSIKRTLGGESTSGNNQLPVYQIDTLIDEEKNIIENIY